MKIVLRHITTSDKGKIKRVLKVAFTDQPAVVILDTVATRNASTSVPVNVANGPKEKPDRERIAGIIDAVLMRQNYRFCNVSFGSETVRKAETPVPAWNWD